MQPDVSIIIPTHDRSGFVKQAVASCFEGNAGIAVEVIVVDDGSSDDTAAHFTSLQDPRVRFLRQDHQGPQVARNRGLREALGRYVKFLDDDDWLAPGSLAREVAILDEQEADICSGDIVEVNQDGTPLFTMPGAKEVDLFPEVLRGTVTTNPLRFTLSSELARQETWDVRLTIKQDVDYFLRIGMRAKRHARVSGTVAFVRRHGLPRVSSRQGHEGALMQLNVVAAVVRQLSREMTLQNAARITAARDALWHWLHICAIADWGLAREHWQLLYGLSRERYLPHRSNPLLGVSDRLIGAMQTEFLLLLPRRLKAFVRSCAR